MGKTVKGPELGAEAIRRFTKHLLDDLRALEQIIDNGMIESGVRRIGAEQELFLVDWRWRPAPLAVEVLAKLAGQGFTTELARFNLETNLDPIRFEGSCFSQMEQQLTERLGKVREVAQEFGGDIVLTGILPSLSKSDLSLDNMTPNPRYYALNEAVMKMRGGSAKLHIDGIDELHIEHDSVMLESCNTSFQVHLQVSAEDYAKFYNAAQAVTGPIIAACANSPLLFGRRLWAETRIALFQQSLDTRSASPHMRELAARVSFGQRWVEESVVEVFQDDLARFRVLIATDLDQDPFEEIEAGRVPKLEALTLYNSTVYRWNRPCYGISDGKPHLRVECRSVPSGPTVIDEIANAAFWIGIVNGAVNEYGDVARCMSFDEAKQNFVAAARHGLNAVFTWTGRESVRAGELIEQRLLPLAREGLSVANIDGADVERYLKVIRDRVRSGQNGSVWLTKSLQSMSADGTRAERLAALTAATAIRQRTGEPVHTWGVARLDEAGGWKQNYLYVEQYMDTDLVTVQEFELVDLVAFLMENRKIRHVLVEDDDDQLVGIVSYRHLIRIIAHGGLSDTRLNLPVCEVMLRDPVTVTPETTTLEAIDIMRRERVAILPVVKECKLVGVITEAHFMPIAAEFMEEKLRGEPPR